MADDNISIYDEIEIEDMTFDEDMQIYHYPCPCGDKFQIALADLRDDEDIAVCPSCSLMIRVIFDKVGYRITRQPREAGKLSRLTGEQDDLPKDPEDDPEPALEEASAQIPVAA
ncbi:diphthamide biosynthesis protein 3 [Colletotrichum chrysophilum]|uniref:Diphthamide biosynthesis protein 3 n=1 Tax=Colletotrichum chrysophilum TaxID=1836956 RepID=A0AAD9ARB9_9PEZI|nr:diphthamide biosynthesis protein 3 [Colletotrichum chrysophilum]